MLIQVVYFPDGTYRVSDTLRAYRNTTGKNYLILLGESRANACVKLADNTFTAAEKAVIRMIHPRATVHNDYFWNSVLRLTIDIGSGNTGATGLVYHNNNVGRLEDVLIKSSDSTGRGKTGLSLDHHAAGLSLIKNLEVRGFDYGISINGLKIQQTFEHVTLSNQHIAGARIINKAVQFRDLTSDQSRAGVPAIITEGRGENGNTVVLESRLTGNAESLSAIMNNRGLLFVRDVTTRGYQSAINDHGTTIDGDDVSECFAISATSCFPQTMPGH